MKKALLGCSLLLASCSAHRQLSCRITSLNGDHVVHTPWHHGMQDCLNGVGALPALQAQSDNQLNFIVKGPKKLREEFRGRVLGGQLPVTPKNADKDKDVVTL